jgi:hypothetical protein
LQHRRLHAHDNEYLGKSILASEMASKSIEEQIEGVDAMIADADDERFQAVEAVTDTNLERVNNESAEKEGKLFLEREEAIEWLFNVQSELNALFSSWAALTDQNHDGTVTTAA